MIYGKILDGVEETTRLNIMDKRSMPEVITIILMGAVIYLYMKKMVFGLGI